MSPLPGPALQVPSPGRSETKSSQLPLRGVGQKSLNSELIGAPRFSGSDHGDASLVRCATQMSLPPSVPDRVEAIYRLLPLGDSMGQPSAAALLTAASTTAGPQASNCLPNAAAGRDRMKAAKIPAAIR